MLNPKSDLSIAREKPLIQIDEIAKKLNIQPDVLYKFGHHKAKLPLSLIDNDRVNESTLILVTAITPTPAGEGKTTVSVGLNDGINALGKNCTVVLREPSLGPVFGIKGGATGGGYSQVVPMEDINLHFTGDFTAVERANNLLSALIDNNIYNKKRSLGIDPRTVKWRWAMDMNDRSLRHIVTGLGGKAGGSLQESGFNITAASEVMAILCLAENITDLKRRLGNIYVGDTYEGNAVYARDLQADGAMAALLKDAIQPNLVQTLEGNPAIIHGGPFANIAQGTNSILGTKMGLSLSDYVVTEAGFGADLGAEKFFNIKCRSGHISPKAVVLVATIRALKYHGGISKDALQLQNTAAVKKGLINLEKHLENLAKFKIPAVVAINRFTSDTDEEIKAVIDYCDGMDVPAAVADGWEKGSAGMLDLADKVIQVTQKSPETYTPTYDLDQSLKSKIEAIATNIYGAKAVNYSVNAKAMLKRAKALGLDHLPICMAKTQSSFSDTATKFGRPRDFTLNIRDVEIASGAGFIIPITGKMLRMPGLPAVPAAENIDVDHFGNISGLF